MIEAIENRYPASKEGAEELLRMMRAAQQARSRRMPHFLTGITVAHKTGDFPPVLANDVGVVYARSGSIVVSSSSSTRSPATTARPRTTWAG